MCRKLLLLVIFLGGINFGHAVMCYNCTSTNMGNVCNDPADLSQIPLVECTAQTVLFPGDTTDYACFKVIVGMAGIQAYFRLCGPNSQDTCDQVAAIVPFPFGVESCESCLRDGCNGATVIDDDSTGATGGTESPATPACVGQNCPGRAQHLRISLSLIVISMVVMMLSIYRY